MAQTSAPFPGVASLAILLGSSALVAFARAITYPFRSKDHKAANFRKDVFFAGLRNLLHRMTIAQSRYLSPPTTEAYREFCKKNRLPPRTIELDPGNGEKVIVGHWLGNPDAEVVILYCHGGGYTQPVSEGHLRYCKRLAEDLNTTARSSAVLMLAYSLAPESPYPTQLREAVTMLRFLIKEEKRSPADIILTGDSAGGGLCWSLLSHLLHPCPGIPSLKFQQPLGGVITYSPFVNFGLDFKSFTRNAQRDILPASMLHRWSGMYVSKSDPQNIEIVHGPVKGDSYSEPGSNSSDWWQGLHRIVGDVFIWAGGDEVLVDSIREFGNDVRKGWLEGGGNARAVVYMETPGEPHVAPIMEIMQSKVKGEAQTAIEAWYQLVLVE